MKSNKDKQNDHVSKNYEAFSKKLPELLKTHKDKYALMKDCEIVNFFNSFEDAYKEGLNLYKVENFSVQKVTNVPIDLGFFSHVLHIR